MTFYSIFSNKKEALKEKIKILIDHREKNSLVPSELSRLNFAIEFTQLPVADYIIDNIAIERKTLSDLKSSIINKRIFSQMQELKQFPLHLIIIEGLKHEDFYQGIIHENALRGFLLSAQQDYKIPIILSEDEKDTAKYISILSNKKSNRSFSLVPKKISLDKNEQIQYILEGFPNIGPVKAKKLLERFGSLINIFNTPEKELTDLLGSRSKDFLALIRHSYKK
jgi:ERCC4-type nuclease